MRPIDFEAAAGARVGREDSGHEALVVIVVVWGTKIEVDRGGAPDVAPPGGEDLDADGVGGEEAGDDLIEDGVREDADQVLTAILPFSCNRLNHLLQYIMNIMY